MNNDKTKEQKICDEDETFSHGKSASKVSFVSLIELIYCTTFCRTVRFESLSQIVYQSHMFAVSKNLPGIKSHANRM